MRISRSEYNKLFGNILFKIIERISRFYGHINETRHSNPDYYSDIISDLETCLWAMLSTTMNLYKSNKKYSNVSGKRLKSLLAIYNDFIKLHEKLSYIPRPDKPVELHRFSRIFKEGLSRTSGKKHEFSIGVREIPTQEIHLYTPVSELRDDLLKKNKSGKGFIAKLEKAKKQGKPPHHITIPRIEVKNPLAWATMAHEIAHSLISHCLKGDCLDHFNEFLTANNMAPCQGFTDDRLRYRLVEYWCDFLGTLIMGHAFWFAQYDAMLFGGFNHTGNGNYPPDRLRLWLIRRVLNQRMYAERVNALEEIFDRANADLLCMCNISKNEKPNTDDNYLVMQFFKYISQSFIFRSVSNGINLESQLNNLLSNFTKNTSSLNNNTLNSFIDALNRGVPIPSVRILESELHERPAQIHEMLLAGVVYRNTALQVKVLEEFDKVVGHKSPIEQVENFINTIPKIFGELDSCLLRSIQISEYVTLLSRNNFEEERENNITPHTAPSSEHGSLSHKSMLTDNEIREKLISRTLSIVPFIDTQQIGSTSLDIRLGTSFQIYHPNRSGIVDFTSNQSLEEAEKNSYMLDLNYLEYIVVAPGQFILGHTMEYLDLPPDIAAELEGRSSYARLGIEIHMTAGFVDSGFSGVLTLEIFNAGPNPVKLFPGLRVGQLRFFQCLASAKPYRDPQSKYRGLLAHTGSLHFKDYEIEAYKKALSSLKGRP